MGNIKEPADIEIVVKSRPWTEKELEELSHIIRTEKAGLSQEMRAKIQCLKKSLEVASID